MRQCVQDTISFSDPHHLLTLTLAELLRGKQWLERKKRKEKEPLSQKMPDTTPNHITQCYEENGPYLPEK